MSEARLQPALAEYEEIVLFANPTSRHAIETATFIRNMQNSEYGDKVKALKTVAGGVEPNAEKLNEKLKPGSLLVVCGGDGTVHLAGNALLHPNFDPDLRDTVLTSKRFGNGNDFDNVIHAEGDVFTNPGQVVPYTPLRHVSTSPEGEKMQQYGLCYLSWGGVSARVATWLNTGWFRSKWWNVVPGGEFAQNRLEQAMVLSAMATARTIEIQEDNEEYPCIITDRIISNIPRMAKIGKPDAPFAEPVAFEATQESNNPISILRNSISLAQGKLPGEHITEKGIGFALLSPTWRQCDGDGTRIPAHTHEHISFAETPLQVLVTSPKAAPRS